jgi:hypothetical protein
LDWSKILAKNIQRFPKPNINVLIDLITKGKPLTREISANWFKNYPPLVSLIRAISLSVQCIFVEKVRMIINYLHTDTGII